LLWGSHICVRGVEIEARNPTSKADKRVFKLTIGLPMPSANKPEPHRQPALARQAARLDERLDAALIETFPASDPIAVGRPTATEPPRRIGHRPAQEAKVRGPSPNTSRSRATAMPAATSARPSKKILRARS